jgi:hypothetical protein
MSQNKRIDPGNQELWFWPQYVDALPERARAEPIVFGCTGIQSAPNTKLGRVYSAGAYIPVDQWVRRPAPDPLPALSIPRCGLFRLPSFCKENWIRASLWEAVDAARYANATVELTRGIISELCDLFGALEAPLSHGVASNQGGEPTVTFDEARNNFPGLHVDSWEGGTLGERSLSRTRLCVNLGPGDRFFLYVPLTLQQIKRSLPRSVWDFCLSDTGELIRQFFKHYPDAPVMRLTVPPGSGYFADTDNMIHDASTLGIELSNTHFTLRGRFRALQCAA